MREDMFKVIVERPRGGRSWASKSKLRYLDKGETRHRITGRRLVREHSGASKYLNENLAPLKRYLFKQRGRKWDDVFSEICARLDTGSTVKMHVREHLDDFVIRQVRIDESGMYWDVSHWGGMRKPDQWYADLYVCPIDGRLKECKQLQQKLGLRKRRYESWAVKSRRKSENLVRLGNTAFLACINGIWYEININNAPWGKYDSELDIYDNLKNACQTRPDNWNITSKKQLSKKELKKHGLKNGGGANE